MIKRRVAVLISGKGTNLQALIDATRTQEDYPATIALVISNKPDAPGLKRAEAANIPVRVLDHTAFPSREIYDSMLQTVLVEEKIDIVCLAGFMRLLSPWFVDRWEGRMLNIHPSLLPEFKGAHAIRDALAAGVSETGCTVHLVTEDMDGGPVMMQATVPIMPNDTEESLAERIHAEEHRLYPQALRRLASRFFQYHD